MDRPPRLGKHEAEGRNNGKSRNGHGRKRELTGSCEGKARTSRDRNGTVEAQFVRKRQRRLESFDDKALSHYARALA